MKEGLTDDYANYRMQRANETLSEIETHVKNNFWNTAMNRMYYACFYAVGALLIKHNIETSSHAGARQMFGQKFVKTGLISKELAKYYTDLFEKRLKGDYNDFFDYDEETVLRMFPRAKAFVLEVEKLFNE